MKSARVLPVVTALLLLGLGVYFAVGALSNHYLDGKSAAADSCGGQHAAFKVSIRRDIVTPAHVQARRCDKLTITNYDNVSREMAFGDHDRHQAYDGIFERNLTLNQSFTVTLNKTGSYHFHDHFQEAVTGTFAVE